jgi:NADH dehydrogenase
MHLVLPSRRAWRYTELTTCPTAQLVQADVHDDNALAALVAGSDLIINLAGILHSDRGEPWGKAFDQVHVQIPARLLGLANERPLVHVSALGCRPESVNSAPSMYLRSKSEAERLLLTRESTGRVVVVRPSVVFGPDDNFLRLFARLSAIAPIVPLAGAAARFSPVHVRDLVSAIARAVAALLGGSMPLGLPDRSLVIEAFGPQVVRLDALLRFAATAAHGRSPWIIPLPTGLARLQAMVFEALPGPPLMSRDNLDSMTVDNVPSGATQVLGAPLLELGAFGIVPMGISSVAADLRRPR